MRRFGEFQIQQFIFDMNLLHCVVQRGGRYERKDEAHRTYRCDNTGNYSSAALSAGVIHGRASEKCEATDKSSFVFLFLKY